MALFPSRLVGEAFQTVADIATWVGLPDAALPAIYELTGQLGDRTRNWALLAPEVIRAAVAEAELVTAAIGTEGAEGFQPAVRQRLTPLQAAQVGLIWRVARRLAVGWDVYVDVDPLVGGATEAAGLPARAAVQLAPPDVRKVKLSTYVDQADESEVALPGPEVFAQWQDNWTAFARGPADDDEEPNFEQLVALDARAKDGRTPYADFAVFLPFARKFVRAHKFTAYVPQPDGGWLKKEIPGPSSYDSWLVSWRVYRVAMIMLNMADEVALTRYARQVERLAKDWPTAWHLVYLADDKMRAEHLEKVRRRVILSIEQGDRPPPLWNLARPWSAAFLIAADSSEAFWDRNVRHIANRWLAQGGRSSVPLTVEEEVMKSAGRLQELRRGAAAGLERQGGADSAGDEGAPLSKKAKKRARDDARLARRPAPFPPPPPPAGGAGPGKGKGKDRFAGGKNTQGRYEVDQEGNPLCYSWNNGRGACSDLAQGAACLGGRVHKCQVCRSPSHPAKDHH
jgi:hypothetical protein